MPETTIEYFIAHWSEPKGEGKKWHDPQWVQGDPISRFEIAGELSKLRKLGCREFRVIRKTVEVLSIDEFERN